jgi:hypothetical protein
MLYFTVIERRFSGTVFFRIFAHFSTENLTLHFFMPLVHIQVLEVRTDEKNGLVHKLMLYADCSSSPLREKRNVSKSGILYCKKSWTFKIPHQANEEINLFLMKRIIFSPNRAIGHCSLPLDWFPTNRVVRDWFPIAKESGAAPEYKTWLLLDVHVEGRKVAKFKAAFSNLRVIPTWPRPVDPIVECPTPPQVVFVLPQSDPGGEIQYTPVGCAQYPSLTMFQPGLNSSSGGWPSTPGSSGCFYPSVDVLPLNQDVPPLLTNS